MLRRLLPVAVLTILAALPAGGCRSGDSCHDYDSPVASCSCNSCGHGRSGSAAGGYVATSGPISGGEVSGPVMMEEEVGYDYE